jgi:hypothetical protein
MSRLVAVFLLALAADTLTYIALPSDSEANPFVLALGPLVAITVRWVAAGVLLAAVRPLSVGWRESLLLVGIVGCSIGAGSNISVLV